MMQSGTNTQVPDAATLSQQIRAQIRQQIEAAQHQGHAAPVAPVAPVAPAPGEATTIQVPTPGGPVVVVPPPGTIGDIVIPARAEHIAIEFFVMVVAIFFVVPIARAFARRIDKKPVSPALDSGLASQLQRIENSVDSMAIEIERISEAQRYMVRLQSDRAPAPALPTDRPAP